MSSSPREGNCRKALGERIDSTTTFEGRHVTAGNGFWDKSVHEIFTKKKGTIGYPTKKTA